MSNVWVTKRKGKRGVRYNVRWIEPESSITRSKVFRHLDRAQDYRSELRKRFEDGTYCAPVKISYDEWVKQHIEAMKTTKRKPKTPKTISSHKEALEALGRYCKPASIKSITVPMMDDFCEKLLRDDYSEHTVNKLTRTIRSALTYAKRAKLIPRNPLIGEDITVEAELNEVDPLEVGEVTALMNAATDLKHKLAISLAYYCGLRRGEISYLEWSGVDLEDMCLKVVAGAEHGKRKNKRKHAVVIRQETADLFRKVYLDRLNNYVFTNPLRFYYSVDKWFSQLAEKSKIRHCTLHDLRRTINTHAKDEGASPEAATQLLGQRSLQTNQDYYTGTLWKQQRQIVESLESIG